MRYLFSKTETSESLFSMRRGDTRISGRALETRQMNTPHADGLKKKRSPMGLEADRE